MKKPFALLLTFCLLASTFSLSALAFERPAGSTAETPVELDTITELPDLSKNIAAKLTAAPHSSPTMLNVESTDWKHAANAIEEKKLADIGNHLKYGFTMLGLTNLERSLSAAVDCVWATGNIGDPLLGQMSTIKEKGALSWVDSDQIYNAKGEPAPEGKGAEDGYIYQTIFTYNFGAVANIESFAYFMSSTVATGYPQAADIYVSVCQLCASRGHQGAVPAHCGHLHGGGQHPRGPRGLRLLLGTD